MRLPAATLCLLLAVGCTSSRGPQASPATQRSAAAARPAAVEVLPGGYDGGFQLSDGVSQCRMGEWGVSCLLRNRRAGGSADTSGCGRSWQEIRFDRDADATESTGCGDGPTYRDADPPDEQPLRPGTGIRVDDLQCVALTTGLDCRQLATTHGFFAGSSAPRLTATDAAPRTAPAARGRLSTFRRGFTGSFTSPSRNIRCSISSSQVSCLVDRHSWHPSDGPPQCETTDPVAVATLDGASTATLDWACGDDGSSGDELSYGRSLTTGPMTCRSRTTGIECRDSESGHAFSVSTEHATVS